LTFLSDQMENIPLADRQVIDRVAGPVPTTRPRTTSASNRRPSAGHAADRIGEATPAAIRRDAEELLVDDHLAGLQGPEQRPLPWLVPATVRMEDLEKVAEIPRRFVIPERSPEYHYSSGGQLAVYRTRDSGETWELMADGLPKQAWAAVLREASAYDTDSLYFGTQSGSFFALGEGEMWVEGVRHLPPILSVEVTPWSG
jgi:hypothetical protein